MKIIFLLFVLLSALTGCLSNPINGQKEPLDAASICLDQFPAPFLPDGHLYTTLSITNIGGYSDSRQMVISYYSQYPDIDTDYEAVPVSFKYLLLPWKWEWRNDITGTLHSLHGGNHQDIIKRRMQIQKALHETLKDPKLDWLSGLVIHAYADSFSHTKNKFNSEEEEAYNVWIGHAIPTLFGNSPDKIKDTENEPKYLGYITDLYKTTKFIDNDKEFNIFKQFVDDLECKGSQCPNFYALYNNENTEEKSRIDKFTECMNSTSRQLSVSEVQQAMDIIYTDSSN